VTYESPTSARLPATRYLATLSRLFVDPRDAVQKLRASRPVGKSILAASIATASYGAVLHGALSDAVAVIRLSGYDHGALVILAEHALFLVPLTIFTLLVIGLAYVPLSLAVLRLLSRTTHPQGLVSTYFEGLVAAALSVWTATLAIWFLPAALVVDPNLGPSVAIWSVLPVAFFVGLMAVTLVGIADAGPARATAASVLAATTLLALAMARSLVGSYRSLILLVATILVVRLVYLAFVAARDSRERLRRNLEAAALNPADARAQFDLGAFFEEDGETDAAVEHYLKAAEADPSDVAPLYRLGHIARVRGDYSKAISWFDAVVQIDDEYSSSEVWREVGSTYFAAGQFDDAFVAFDRFLEKRPSDAEGRYSYALTLAALGESERANQQMQLLIDVVRGGPAFKQRVEQEWLARAERYLKGETGRS
jgi:Flp pilus assembly protein TadD